MHSQEKFGMNGNQGGGVLNRTRELVEEILRTLPRPLTIDVTDDVLYAIQSTPRWRTQFDKLCSEFTDDTVCKNVGKAVSFALVHAKEGKRYKSRRNSLCGSYTRLHLPEDASLNTNESRELPVQISPVNLILYGPPGTGKTYCTTEEAIRLCGEAVPQKREDLIQNYQRLLAAGRIEFVTFHQSMSYEDFVEGRQPMTGSDEDGDTSSAGFRLETVPGIFRRVAKRAETSHGPSPGDDAITVTDRRVFKMSIGEANNPEDAHLFEEAMAGDYTLLGFEDINWSDDKYVKRKAIIKEIIETYKKKGRPHTDVNARSGAVQMPFIFRNWVRPGDIVVVSKGNSLFRAIGEFTGDYEFHSRPEGGYAHRRAVRWLWVDREGVPVSEIYTRRFTQKTIYVLDDTELKIPALERYLNSQQADGPAEPEPFVLIIDEINRANISKVFGELITLLEPDKRLGQPNALKVRPAIFG